MKGRVKYIEWLGVLVLFLIPCLCLADNVTLNFTPSNTDESVKYLSDLFGVVPGISQLSFGGITILGKIFYMFNIGILGISGMFLAYNTAKITFDVSTTGEALKSATMWSAVRTAAGISLLVPTLSGYSVVNTIVMWVVMQSIGLADSTWNEALDYLKTNKGAPIAQESHTVDYSLVNYNLDSSTADYSNVGSADILRSLICTRAVSSALKANQDRVLASSACTGTNPPTYCGLAQKSIDSIFLNYQDIPNLIQFPYINNTTALYSDYGLVDSNGKLLSAPLSQLSGVCGSISYNTIITSDPTRAATYISAKRQGLLDMISALNSVADSLWKQASSPSATPPLTQDYINKYVLYQNGSEKVGFFYDSTITPIVSLYNNNNLTVDATAKLTPLPNIAWPIGTNDLLRAAVIYQDELKPARMTSNSASINRNQELTEAKKQGWIGAGGYYDVLQTSDSQTTAETAYYKSTLCCDANHKPLTNSDQGLQTSRVLAPGFALTTAQQKSLSTAITTLDDGTNTTTTALYNALYWVYLSAPYTMLLGNSLMPSPSPVTNGVISAFHASDYNFPTLSCPVEHVGAIDTQMISGIALATMAYAPYASPAAIAAVPMLMDIPMCYLVYDVNHVLNMWDCLMGSFGPGCVNNQNLDPVLRLHKLGDEMISDSFNYFTQIRNMVMGLTITLTASALIISVISWAVAPGSFWGATQGVSDAVNASLSSGQELQRMILSSIYMNLPLGLAIAGPLLVTGITLSIYVPLIPYMLFLFGVIGWFISVLVLMAAAPIICFLMLWGASSQENPLLSREAEQFVMQVIGVFFRPTLMIIGLIVGMLLSFIGVNVLNLGFTHIYNNVVIIKGENTKTILYLIKQLGFVIVYTFSMVSIVNMCFSTIHLLYSEVMRIAGFMAAPATGLEERSMEGVKAGLDTFAQAGASGVKENAIGAKDSMFFKSRLSEKKEKKKNEPKAKSGGGGNSEQG